MLSCIKCCGGNSHSHMYNIFHFTHLTFAKYAWISCKLEKHHVRCWVLSTTNSEQPHTRKLLTRLNWCYIVMPLSLRITRIELHELIYERGLCFLRVCVNVCWCFAKYVLGKFWVDDVLANQHVRLDATNFTEPSIFVAQSQHSNVEIMLCHNMKNCYIEKNLSR